VGSAVPGSGHSVKLELAAESARRFGKLNIKVTGNSMLPWVWPGDVLTVVRQPIERFHSGDIVLACRHGRGAGRHSMEFVAHRIVRKQFGGRGRYLITRGDSLPHNDPPLEEGAILGRVVAVTRNGRPVDASLTRSRQIASWFLRRSVFSVRVLMKLARMRAGGS